MKRVVISGIGAVLPSGAGSSYSDIFKSEVSPDEINLSDGKKLFHYPVNNLENHPFYPDRKQCRHMRMDAIYSYTAAQISIEDAGLEDADHTNTSYYGSSGQCYGDMWPSIKIGLEASIADGAFDIHKFGREGISKVNPFFSLRTLAALPMALISEKYQIHGENFVYESMGAESVDAIRQGVDDIRSGRTNIAIIASQDFLGNPHEIDNMYFNGYYQGNFKGASSASIIILEEYEHNKERNGKRYAELISCESVYYPVHDQNEILLPENCYAELVPDKKKWVVDTVNLNGSGCDFQHEKEISSVKINFPDAKLVSYYKQYGTLLAGSEPFGVISLILNECSRGVSLSRSIFGMESAVLISREEANA